MNETEALYGPAARRIIDRVLARLMARELDAITMATADRQERIALHALRLLRDRRVL